MLAIMNTPDLLSDLGEKVKALRLACNWTREELATRCGVPYSTLRRLESTGEGSMRHYIAVFRTLGSLEDFSALRALPPVSPYELIQHRGKPRQRASARSTDKH